MGGGGAGVVAVAVVVVLLAWPFLRKIVWLGWAQWLEVWLFESMLEGSWKFWSCSIDWSGVIDPTIRRYPPHVCRHIHQHD